jgi:hypothetical protein
MAILFIKWIWFPRQTNDGIYGTASPQPNDLLNLDVGSFFLLSVPPDSRHEDRNTIKLRAAFKKRLTEAVIRSKRNEFPNNGKSVEQRADNGLIRNGCEYVEIACVVKAYPHREEYISARFSQNEVETHVEKGGGMDIIIRGSSPKNTKFSNDTYAQKN